MIKENKKNLTEKDRDMENKPEMTKPTTFEVTGSIFTDANLTEYPRFTPLKRGDFNINTVEDWSEIRTKNQPRRRSFHVSFLHNEYLYIHGGVDIVTGKLADMKRIKVRGQVPAWETVTPLGVALGK